MVKQTFKTEYMNSNIVNNTPVPPTVYEEPEKTLMNFPSSIMNGITQEGGLVSLTFKAIKCVEFVENADYMRRTILRNGDSEDPIRITDEKLDSTNIINELQKEIQELQNQSTAISSDNDWIGLFQDELLTITENKNSLENYKNKLFQQYEKEHSGNEISFINDSYRINKVEIPGVQVEHFEDVKQIDLTPYQKQASIEINSSQASAAHAQSEDTIMSSNANTIQGNNISFS